MIEHDNLEENQDAVDYDLRSHDDSGIDFYTQLAQETGDPILEIACGTGRVTIPIARLGLEVTGLDLVPGMLAQARGKSTNLPITWVEADGRTFNLDTQFRLVFLTGNSFQAFLFRSDQEALLERVRVHLQPEGLFAFETRNPGWVPIQDSLDKARDPQPEPRSTSRPLFTKLETRSQEDYWGTYLDADGRKVRLTKSQTYDRSRQILEWTTIKRWWEGDQERTKVNRIAVRYTFQKELEALMAQNGFQILRSYGDWNLEPLTNTSPSIILVCHLFGE